MHPDMEAIAGEVALLRSRFKRSIAWGITNQRTCQLSWRCGFGFSPFFYKPFRVSTFLLQRLFDINHVFGGLGDWFHLSSLTRTPAVMTVAALSNNVDTTLLSRIKRFAVEWPGALRDLDALGISSERIKLILPPVDPVRFSVAKPPDQPFTVLFASSPDRADWFESRGITLLLSVARQRPNVRFRLLWRPWGDGLTLIRELLSANRFPNVEIKVGKCKDMSGEYRNCHATIAPFTDASRCKPVPNSLLEGFACGRPAIMTDLVGLADVKGVSDANVVCRADVESVCSAIDQLQVGWPMRSRRVRELAEDQFSERRFIREYEVFYESVL
jgi:glycosyltransferase involved in cell wall biosynthesis